MKGHNLGQEDGPKSVGPEGVERCCNFCGLLEEEGFLRARPVHCTCRQDDSH